ncbi:glycosyltransferase [Pseudoxanthomonas suwonensis]|uniref:glycosyltransferase n=1 Tax=Pseudoxanthomonas suwonensis TaxID=314722 RepID=UPI0009DD2545|nr:glycosyltransferase [Pseudoxanthomonas suwonensis]
MFDPPLLGSCSASTTLVTVTYADRIAYLSELLRRAFDCEHVADAVVVSNGSTSDLTVLEHTWGTRLQVIRLDNNTGSANAYGIGIKAALDNGSPYLWLMDDDNAPKAGALSILLQRLEHLSKHHGSTKAAVLGLRPTHQADVAQGISESRAYPPRSSFFGFHYRQIPFKIWRRIARGRGEAHSAPRFVRVPYAPYGGLLAARALFESIGLPMHELVLYADDTEYTHRITSAGGVIELVTEAELEDLEGSWNLKESYPNAFVGWLQGNSDLRAFYAARNQAFFDTNVWMKSKMEYFINEVIYILLLRYFSSRLARGNRYQLLIDAIRQGQRSELGISSDHHL